MSNKLFNDVANIDAGKELKNFANSAAGKSIGKSMTIVLATDNKKSEIKNKIKSSSKKTQEEVKEKAKKKATEVISEASQKAVDEIKEINITKQVEDQFKSLEIQDLVDNLIEKQIDETVKDKVKEARQAYNTSSLGNAVATAEAYYGKILNSEKLLSDMRNDYTKDLNKTITAAINQKLSNINIGGKWGKKLLAQSKIVSSLTKFVTRETAAIINSVISNKAIATVSKDIINTINRLKTSTMNQLNKTFKDQIAYAKKLKKAVEDKIKLFNKEKEKYIKKMQAYVDKLKKAVTEQVKKIEQAAINEISKYVKINAGSLGGLI